MRNGWSGDRRFGAAWLLLIGLVLAGCSQAPPPPVAPRSAEPVPKAAPPTPTETALPAPTASPPVEPAPSEPEPATAEQEPPLEAEAVRAREGMVATVHPLATEAALAAVRNGGNAVDAAVAAALTLGVVDGHNSGIGGGCFILIRTAEGKLVAIDGRETAPAKATRDMYLKDGQAQPELSTIGALASGVPGALAAYDMAVREHGRLKLADLLLPAAKLAEEGFAVDAVYAEALAGEAETLAKFAGSRAVLLKEDGTPYTEGERLRQPDLAATYRGVADEGIGYFYGGPFAERVGQWMAQNDGILTREDLAGYKPLQRTPLVTTFRGYTLVGFPPPSSGGVHVAQILNILEHFELKRLAREDPDQYAHLVAEAMKLAFADRAYWLGDPAFAQVPRGLVDKQYGTRLAERIDPAKARAVDSHGQPPAADSDLFQPRHTTHIAAADAAGNWVAITATVNTTFGSKVIVPGTGVILNNQMDDFSIAPGVPNAFGLLGAKANEIEPGKRPLSSMSPTIVLEDDRPVMTLGAAGGPKIITQVVLAVLNHLELGLELGESLARPRLHHQWQPDQILLERAVDDGLVEALQARGHEVRRMRYSGVTQAISVLPESRGFIGVHDPRAPGQAAGW